MLKAVFVFCLFPFLVFAQFKEPFPDSAYYEYVFNTNGENYRYYGVSNDTIINGEKWKALKIFDEPPVGNYIKLFKFDTVSLKLYNGTYGCLDSTGNHLSIGFNLPIGFTWNTCSDTLGGVFFRSKIIDTLTLINWQNYNGPLKFVERLDTIGGTIEGTTHLVFSEFFGFIQFFRGYGSPFGGGAYAHTMAGAIIDGIVYGEIKLNVNQISSEIPEEYSLQQNYPNPFNPSTVIKFSLPENTHVNLTVYDQLGRIVESLVDSYLSTGTYQFIFNAKNLSSGVYYYRLSTNNYFQTKKMILLR